MSSHYESVQIAALYPEAFAVPAPVTPVGREVWPRQAGVFIRPGVAPGDAAPGAGQPARELVVGQFGLVPR